MLYLFRVNFSRLTFECEIHVSFVCVLFFFFFCWRRPNLSYSYLFSFLLIFFFVILKYTWITIHMQCIINSMTFFSHSGKIKLFRKLKEFENGYELIFISFAHFDTIYSWIIREYDANGASFRICIVVQPRNNLLLTNKPITWAQWKKNNPIFCSSFVPSHSVSLVFISFKNKRNKTNEMNFKVKLVFIPPKISCFQFTRKRLQFVYTSAFVIVMWLLQRLHLYRQSTFSTSSFFYSWDGWLCV